jgi:hypothetical protein
MMLKFERVWTVTDFRHDDSDDEETSGLKDARDPGAGPKTPGTGVRWFQSAALSHMGNPFFFIGGCVWRSSIEDIAIGAH